MLENIELRSEATLDAWPYPLNLVVFPRDPMLIELGFDPTELARDEIKQILSRLRDTIGWIIEAPDAHLADLARRVCAGS